MSTKLNCDDFELAQVDGLPAQVQTLPGKEEWSWWDKVSFGLQFGKLDLHSRWHSLVHFVKCTLHLEKVDWGSFDDISRFLLTHSAIIEDFKPEGMDHWKDDANFGFQRMCGPNHSSIELCTGIPRMLPVTDKMLRPFIEGMTIQQAISEKRLFIVDLKLMQSINNFQRKDSDVVAICAPIGLFFYEKDSQKLKPVAIQLYQDPGEDNPIFLPSDPVNLWTWVKMWFNNADANYHQAIVHLGFTHLLMEGPAVVTHRDLQEDHPIFKLLIPHFYNLLPINTLARDKLIPPKGGFVDTLMNMGRTGAFTLIRERLKEWRLDVDGTFPEDLKRRGLDDTNVLPPYHYRNDALKLYHVIKKYVDSYVKTCYDTADKLKNDDRIQNWARALVKPRAKKNCGCGILGVPGNGRLDNTDQLVTIVTAFIFMCSVVHAGTNFPQYDHYGFPPNYPALLKGFPPNTKADVKEEVMLHALANRTETFETMKIMRLLSKQGDHGLGDFEVDVQFDNKGPLTQFRQDLKELEDEILNETRQPPYDYLRPSKVPNSIDI